MRRRTAANATRLWRPRRSRPVLERLESRYLYTAALTGEVLANNYVPGPQQTYLEAQKAVAVDASGNSIVVWSGVGTGDVDGIFGRRYDSAGNSIGSAFRVNTTTAGAQTSAAVATDDAGDFVVVWASQGQDGSGFGVYAQRFSAAGAALGGEFRVNATTA